MIYNVLRSIHLRLAVAALSAAFTWVAVPATAQPMGEKIMPMDGVLAKDGRSVLLKWTGGRKQQVTGIDINRRPYGTTGGDTWEPIALDLRPGGRYSDDTISPGRAYEYQVIRKGQDFRDLGYWVTGRDVPAVEFRGTALMIVEDGLEEALTRRLDRFEADLAGDGWNVQRHVAPRHIPATKSGDRSKSLKAARALKGWVARQVRKAPDQPHSVILIGHVPIVRSGSVAPDGHEKVSLASDLYYGDINGFWPEMQAGSLRPNMVPDLVVDLAVGRIDFEPMTKGNRDREIALLAAYLDKNHHWRHGYLGDLRRAYGKDKNLFVERTALRNLVGPANIEQRGHHDTAPDGPWLWGVDFGKWNGWDYKTEPPSKAVFAINFGSHKQKFDRRGNPLVALLAEPFYSVAVGWGGRPSWWLHHMALGGTVGDVHLRTANNGATRRPYRQALDYYPTGRYLMRNPIWVNLMGDPTLRGFPLDAPKAPRARTEAGHVVINWTSADTAEVTGYAVYRRDAPGEPFARISGDDPISGTEFVDEAPVPDARYMIRSYGRKSVYAGSFFTFSQGVYAVPDAAPAKVKPPEIQARSGRPVRFDLPGTLAIVAPPSSGRLEPTRGGWQFTPEADTAGPVTLSVSHSTALATERLDLEIAIAP